MLELLKKCKTTMACMALKSKNYEDQNKVIELIKQIDAIIEKNQEGN
jgi:hypothetical protein